MPVYVWAESKIELPQKEVEESERKASWVGVLHECEVLLGWKRYSSVAKMRSCCICGKVFKQHANKEGRVYDWTAYSTRAEINSELFSEGGTR